MKATSWDPGASLFFPGGWRWKGREAARPSLPLRVLLGHLPLQRPWSPIYSPHFSQRVSGTCCPHPDSQVKMPQCMPVSLSHQEITWKYTQSTLTAPVAKSTMQPPKGSLGHSKVCTLVHVGPSTHTLSRGEAQDQGDTTHSFSIFQFLPPTVPLPWLHVPARDTAQLLN